MEAREPRTSGSIGTRTLRGVGWAYGSYVGGKVLVLISTAILARLLTPEDFGLVALALVIIGLIDAVSDLGLSPALIVQRAEALHERAETVFVATIGIGLLMSAAVAALSPLAAAFFDEPGLVGIGIALGGNFLIKSFGRTHYALAQKNLDFKPRTYAEFSEVAVRGATGIALALLGFGAWSLVIGYLVGSVVMVIVIWALVPWRPRLQPRLSHLRELTSFGAAISVVNVIAAYIANIDYLIIGRVLGAANLGVYSLAFRLPELAIMNLSTVAGTVLFPAFTSVDRDGLARAFLVSMRYTLLIALPLTAILVVLAEPIVLGVFGDQWAAAVVPMQILTLYTAEVTISIPAGSIYKATKRVGVLIVLGIFRAVAVTIALVLVVDQGLEAAALAQGGVAVVAGVIGIGLAVRLLRVRLIDLWRESWPALLAAALMVPPMLLVANAISSPWPAILAGTAAGGVAYLAGIGLFARDQLRHARRTMFPAPPPAAAATPDETGPRSLP